MDRPMLFPQPRLGGPETMDVLALLGELWGIIREGAVFSSSSENGTRVCGQGGIE